MFYVDVRLSFFSSDRGVFVYCCDFAESAVNLVKVSPALKLARPFQFMIYVFLRDVLLQLRFLRDLLFTICKCLIHLRSLEKRVGASYANEGHCILE